MYEGSYQHASFAYKFTGKERDSESGLDNFGARYMSSQYGRFMTPDWSAKPEGVPYAKLDNPQSLNLYAYVLNNPVSRMDPDGHIDCSGGNALGAGCQYLLKWNADHGISSSAGIRSNAPGVPVVLPNGSKVPDNYNANGHVMMSPTADLSDVADAGKKLKAKFDMLIAQGQIEAASALLSSALAANVATGGNFDYQRAGHQWYTIPEEVGIKLFEQFPNFRDVSNFNVGLFAQQAGLSLEDTLRIAGGYAGFASSNASSNSPYGLAAQTREFIETGYKAGSLF